VTDELEAIRARHEADEQAAEEGDGVPPLRLIAAHIDRGDLLRLLDAARGELKALKRSQALDELVAISQEAGLYDAPVPERLGAEEIFRQLAERQEPLGADFEAAVGDLSTLYETDVPGATEVETSAWTDDDQRNLSAVVADAMWHWDDMPMDCDDATVLTSVLKSSLQDNGFEIVRLATRAQGESS